MQKGLGFVVVALLSLLAGCSGAAGENQVVGWTAQAKPGSQTVLVTPDGGPVVTIPGDALSAAGRLEVSPLDLDEHSISSAASGWSIDLEGADLTGDATLSFGWSPSEGEPTPLVGYEDGEGSLQLVPVTVGADTFTVRTNHFSNWVVLKWQDVFNRARANLDSLHASAYGEAPEPVCGNDQAVLDSGIYVNADEGNRAKWCLGQTQSGELQFKVVNTRGYAVTLDYLPGMTLIEAPGLPSWTTSVAETLAVPQGPGHKATIIGGGDEVEFRLSAEPLLQGVQLLPSEQSFFVDSLWWVLDNPFIPAAAAWDVAKCAANSYEAVADSTGLTTAEDLLGVLKNANKVARDCLPKGPIRAGVDWIYDGLSNVSTQYLPALADVATDVAQGQPGYRIFVHLPDKPLTAGDRDDPESDWPSDGTYFAYVTAVTSRGMTLQLVDLFVSDDAVASYQALRGTDNLWLGVRNPGGLDPISACEQDGVPFDETLSESGWCQTWYIRDDDRDPVTIPFAADTRVVVIDSYSGDFTQIGIQDFSERTPGPCVIVIKDGLVTRVEEFWVS